MWQRGFTNAVLVVDRPMCGICSRDLPSALPPGATLLVVSTVEGQTIVRSTHAAGSPVPAIAGSTGRPWGGPGGTPGFNPSGIQNIANGLAQLQRWAEQLSMLSAAIAAWNEVLGREDEITQLQNDYPLYPVYVRIYWKVINENNPNLMKIYEYFGADIQSGYSGIPISLWDANQRNYLMVIGALKRDEFKASNRPVTKATWRDGYASVYSALRGSRSEGGDAVAALRILNGSPMYDILPILLTLRANDPPLFDKAQQAIAWPSAEVGKDRLRAAFFAVELSQNSGNDAFGYYKAACKEFGLMPGDQQKDIENFLAGKSNTDKTALTSPVGEWNVKVGRWYWIYKFAEKSSVTWRDPFNGMNGKGKWKMGDGTILIDWSPAKSRDTWYLPLDPADQKGKAYVDGEGTFKLAATKV
jgi:hypothetical protein